MRLFDPSRATYGEGRLYALAPASAHVGIPGLYIEPNASDAGQTWEVRVFMPVSNGSYRGFSADIPHADLPALLTQWLEDPERVLTERLGYTYNAKEFVRKANARRTDAAVAQGLAALGLD